MSEARDHGCVVSFRLAIPLRVIRSDRDTFNPKDYKYVTKELCYELGTVVGQNRIRGTIGKDPVVQERGSDEVCGCVIH